mgnify:CR=1 FL=1
MSKGLVHVVFDNTMNAFHAVWQEIQKSSIEGNTCRQVAHNV